MPRRGAPWGSALLLIAVLCTASCGKGPQGPTVAAAASLRNVMPDLIAGFGQPVTVTYGASGTLRKQVEGGAPIDLILFASAVPVDALIGDGLARADTRRRLATNEIVLITPTDSKTPVTWATLPSLPPGEHIAIGEPGAVPAGRYAKEALIELGSWEALRDRIVFAGDVAAVLAYVRRGEVAAAAVYSTDVSGIEDITIADRATWAGAPKPEVIGAMISTSEQAQAFFDYVASPAGVAIFERFGFGPA